MTRLLAESSRFLWHHLADLGHNHLVTLAVSGQHDTLRLSFHDVNWREHAESKTSSTDALPTLCFTKC